MTKTERDARIERLRTQIKILRRWDKNNNHFTYATDAIEYATDAIELIVDLMENDQ